jgi:hypothetical protein
MPIAFVSPSTVMLQSQEKQTFSATGATSWEIDPPGIGVCNPKSGPFTEYTAPDPIRTWEQISVVAKNAAGAEIARATVELFPPPLKITPNTVDLASRQAQHFSVEPSETVTWSLNSSEAGKIDPNTGVYTAPSWIWSQRAVIVTATSTAQRNRVSTATITLQDTPMWRWMLAVYWLIVLVVLGYLLVSTWPSLSSQETASVLVSPPLVTLKIGGQPRQFTASTPGSTEEENADFEWSVNPPGQPGIIIGGKFTPPKEPIPGNLVTIVAKKKGDPMKTATAIVKLSEEGSLQVFPAAVTVTPAQIVPFTAVSEPVTKLQWELKPRLGTIDPETAIYTAPVSIERSQTVTILATGNGLQAAADVRLLAPEQASSSRTQSLLIFVFGMGALGAYLQSAMSFVTYVGNRQFLSSWLLWYLFRPWLGGILAVLFFFVIGAGFVVGQSVTEIFSVAAISGLVGLFSAQATLKLKELVETIFTTRSDPRSDRLGTAGQAQSSAPTIASISPLTIPRGASPVPLLSIAGSNFVNGCKVRVNNSERTITSFSPDKVTVNLVPADIASATTLKIVVVNPNGETSNEATVTVQ